MSQFKPTHRLDNGTLVELEHVFTFSLSGSAYGLFHFEDGSYDSFLMERVTELPKTIQVAAHEEPEPLRAAPEVSTEYWVIDVLNDQYVSKMRWQNADVDQHMLSAGEAYATKEDALASRAARQKARGFA